MFERLDEAMDLVIADLEAPGDLAAKTKLRRAIANLPFAALVVDDRARYVEANPAAVALTGYRIDELQRLAVPDLTGMRDAAHVGPLWQAFLDQGRQRGTYELMARDGTAVTVEYVAQSNVAPGLHLSLLKPL